MSWIKVEHCSPDKVEIDKIAQMLGIDHDAVFGKCIRFWIWADQQSIDGNALSVTKAFLDRNTFQQGFADALISVGWLIEDGDSFRIPNFDRHNGESAKKRANTAKRVSEHRSVKRKCNTSSVTDALPEKRREEKIYTHPRATIEHLKDPKFAALFQRFINHSETANQHTITDIQSEEWLYKLADLAIDEACEALRYSTERGAKVPFFRGEWRQAQLLSGKEPEPRDGFKGPKAVARGEPLGAKK